MFMILTASALVVLAVQCLLLYRLLRSGTVQQQRQQQEAEKEVKSPMDVGFDNIMRYEVGGRTGFGPPEQDD